MIAPRDRARCCCGPPLPLKAKKGEEEEEGDKGDAKDEAKEENGDAPALQEDEVIAELTKLLSGELVATCAPVRHARW